MAYSKKTVEYALSPDGAYPIDARSHFESFADAYSAINYDSTTYAKNYDEALQQGKSYYVGQIITTTGLDV